MTNVNEPGFRILGLSGWIVTFNNHRWLRILITILAIVVSASICIRFLNGEPTLDSNELASNLFQASTTIFALSLAVAGLTSVAIFRFEDVFMKVYLKASDNTVDIDKKIRSLNSQILLVRELKNRLHYGMKATLFAIGALFFSLCVLLFPSWEYSCSICTNCVFSLDYLLSGLAVGLILAAVIWFLPFVYYSMEFKTLEDAEEIASEYVVNLEDEKRSQQRGSTR